MRAKAGCLFDRSDPSDLTDLTDGEKKVFGVVECPYCGVAVEMEHDPGFIRGLRWGVECVCGEWFVYRAARGNGQIIVTKAPCLGDASRHDFELVKRSRRYRQWRRCSVCGYEDMGGE